MAIRNLSGETVDGIVGIGTTNLGTEARLHVGKSAATGGEGGQIILQQSADGSLAGHIDNFYSTNDYLRILKGDDTTSSALVSVFDLTNVRLGIGVYPEKALDVSGNARLQGGDRKLIFNNGSVETSLDQMAGAVGGLGTLGRFGVGTVAPNNNLQVVGNITFGTGATNEAVRNMMTGGTMVFQATDANHRIIIRGSQDTAGTITGNSNKMEFYEFGEMNFYTNVNTGTSSRNHALGLATNGNATFVGSITTNSGTITLVNGSNTRNLACDGSGNLDISNAANNATIFHLSDNALTLGTSIGTGTLTLYAGPATFTGTGEFAGAIRITETSTAQNILIGNQDSGGVNKPSMIQSSNANLSIGYGDSWTGEGGSMTQIMTVNSSQNVGVSITSPLGKIHTFSTSTNHDANYGGNSFGVIVSQDNGNNAGDEGNGIVFTQQYAADNVDAGQVRTGAIIGHKVSATGSFGGGLKFKVQPAGANPLATALTLSNNSSATFAGVVTANNSIQVQNDDSGFICRNAAGTVIGTMGAESSSTPNVGMTTIRNNGTTTIQFNSNGSSYINGGNVGIGYTNPGSKLSVNGDGGFVSNSNARVLYLTQNAVDNGNIVQFLDQSGNNVWELVGRNTNFYIYNNQNSVGYVFESNASNGYVAILKGGTDASYPLDVTGSIRSTADVIAYSDRRVKENIKTIDNALDKVTKLRGVSYNRKDIEDKSTKIGVIAQEVKDILPEVVDQDGDDKYSVAYGNMAGLFIEAIKELKAEIEELKKNK
jgi:hypothetical protein